MKRRLMALVFAGILAATALGGCAGKTEAPAGESEVAENAENKDTAETVNEVGDDEQITLKFATGASECVTALNTIFTNYNKEHPNVTVEVTVLPGGVAGFNSAMASKLAAGDAPDLFQYQWGSQINT